MKPLAILGPTAVGKSSLAMALAERLGGEIVSVDSRQAYRGIDVGTAKPSCSDRERIPHHLIDVLDLREKNDAERFARLAAAAVDDILQRGRLPILTGGSGLYFRAIFNGFFAIDLDPAERRAFAGSIAPVPTPELYRRLNSSDPESARRIHPNDRYRIVRALEVLELSGVPLSEHFRRQRADPAYRRIECRTIGLTMPRDVLYACINERTRRMMAEGWIEEVERLIQGGADPAWPGFGSLGYPEVLSLVRGELTREQAIDRVARLTRQYAKRQLTWFRKIEGVTWFDTDRRDVAELVFTWLRA
ncbi:MAG TPA: tRNA (adenosine(37)-N6)-dimethylallyltransferase MiaA [Patescibacteria group bacterium]|nr:tRNA (adenosine(37)-N6)-dimethylallyltransferase MiaA [Patescibacteria group bacterium]